MSMTKHIIGSAAAALMVAAAVTIISSDASNIDVARPPSLEKLLPRLVPFEYDDRVCFHVRAIVPRCESRCDDSARIDIYRLLAYKQFEMLSTRSDSISISYGSNTRRS